MPASILDALKQYISDAMPGGKLNPELTFDINKSPVPRAIAGIRSFFGEAPDELGVSVMDPRYNDIKSVADKAYWGGKVSEALPVLGALKQATAPARLVGGYSGVIPMSEFERNASRMVAPENQRTLFHTTDVPWEGNTPRPGTWFTDVPPTRDNPFGQSVRAYTIPKDVPISAPLERGRNFYADLANTKEPIATVNDSGVTSYVVRDPSVLNRLEVQRMLSRPIDRQIGAVGPIDPAKRRFLSSKLENLEPKQAQLPEVYNPPAAPQQGALNQMVNEGLQTPLSRRQVLQSMASQALRRFVPSQVLGPLSKLARIPDKSEVSSIVNPELKAAVYNLPRGSLDWNWNNELLNRGFIAKNVLSYAGQPVIGEGKLSLKQALRQLKTEPETYDKLKQTLHELGNEQRAVLGGGSKQEYLDALAYAGHPKNIIARESRLWDINNGKFKQARLPSESSPYPMYDPELSPMNENFKEIADIYPEFKDKLKGLTNKEAKAVWSEYSKGEEGKLLTNILKTYRKNENDYFNQLAKSKGGQESTRYPGNYKSAIEALQDEAPFYTHEIKNPKDFVLNKMASMQRVPSLEDLKRHQRTAGTNFNITQQHIEEAKKIAADKLKKAKFETRFANLYKDLGVETPVYKPANVSYEDILKHIDQGSLSKVKPSSGVPEEGFARGGLAQYKECNCHG